MKAFRRLLGGEPEPAAENAGADGDARGAAPAGISGSAEDDERAYELELAREEARRLDELQQRQLKYADRSWTPPAQGGERRADDEEAQAADS